jgi:hypothetical protein
VTSATTEGLEATRIDQDLRAAIAAALDASPVDEHALRNGVWTHVIAQRQAGTSPGQVIMQLTNLVEAARLQPLDVRQTVLRRVILWCVEAYFGHLGGDVVGQEDPALSDFPVMAARDDY